VIAEFIRRALTEYPGTRILTRISHTHYDGCIIARSSIATSN